MYGSTTKGGVEKRFNCTIFQWVKNGVLIIKVSSIQRLYNRDVHPYLLLVCSYILSICMYVHVTECNVLTYCGIVLPVLS